ncbi:MAG: hypothetical protein IJ618_04580 [Prevotella sp.]|nr:hypothetical protein [Prevotella sp.]
MSKKKSADDGEAKEHKRPWQETYATVAEIKAFLSDHVYLRYNTVKHRVEARVPPGDPFIEHSELAEFVSDTWQPMSDRLRSTLLMVLQTLKDTREKDLQTVLGSGFVPSFHPFLYYLNRLPPWDGQDYILELSATVSVKGGAEEQLYFYELLKRWLVGMVASWLDEDTVNQAVLVFIGEQGRFKTTWFSMLLPPALRDYFRIKVNASRVGKDDLIAMSQYGLVCYEELEAIEKHFRRPGDGEHGEFYTATDILLVVSEGPSLRFTAEKIGSAMRTLGYAQCASKGRRGYRVVRYKPEEIEANRRLLAFDVEREEGAGGALLRLPRVPPAHTVRVRLLIIYLHYLHFFTEIRIIRKIRS